MQVGVSYCEAGWQVSKWEVDGDGTVEGTGRRWQSGESRIEMVLWRWQSGGDKDGRVGMAGMAEWRWQVMAELRWQNGEGRGWQNGDGRMEMAGDGRV